MDEHDLSTAPTPKMPNGDALAIVLFCLASIMAIILSFEEKTPWTIALLLSMMFSFAIYPTLHFFRTSWVRFLVLIIFGAGTVGFGYKLWPKKLATATDVSKHTNEGKFDVSAPIATKTGQPAQTNVIGACHLDADGSPCELICSASNPSSQLAAHEVTMGFNRLIPIKTGVSASPEDRVRLEQSDTLPIQNGNGSFPDFRAFAVNIPLIPPASKVEFTVWTNDIGNKKACSEQQLIQKHRRKVMAAYFAAVSKRQPTVKTPDIDQLLLADAKKANLFHPDIIESDRGKQKVEFITKADEKTTLLALSVYKLLPNYQDVLAPEEKWECMAPVYNVERTGGGTTTFSELVPLAHAYVDFELLIDPQKPVTIQKQCPKQPESYTCSP